MGIGNSKYKEMPRRARILENFYVGQLRDRIQQLIDVASSGKFPRLQLNGEGEGEVGKNRLEFLLLNSPAIFSLTDEL